MIDVNELRIGNWFLGGWRDAKKPMQVSADHLSIWYGHTNMAQFPLPEPIPLSPEVLIACGFVFGKDGNYRKDSVTGVTKIELVNKRWEVWLCSKRGVYLQFITEVKSLHQLQNLYYALTQTELNYQPTTE